jgi:hypothetical protein
VSRTVLSARKGQLERVHLAASGSGRLCAGTYKGSVSLTRSPVCGPPTFACPQYVVLSQRVGTFRFRVK